MAWPSPRRIIPCDCISAPSSGLAQLDYVVDGKVVYHPDYPYRSGITKELEVYQRAFADSVVSELGVPEGSLCVDIGSNDGTLLSGFKRVGMRTLGVEPTNIARIAREENGIETVQAFFTEQLAGELARDHGHAKVITMTNVFAHMAPLGEVMRGIRRLLDQDDGVFITESHYLLDVIEKNQFDTVYHEHIRTYSLRSLVALFAYYGLEVFDVRRADRYGGNIRAYGAPKGKRKIAPAVKELLDLEVSSGLFEKETYARFREPRGGAARQVDDAVLPGAPEGTAPGRQFLPRPLLDAAQLLRHDARPDALYRRAADVAEARHVPARQAYSRSSTTSG